MDILVKKAKKGNKKAFEEIIKSVKDKSYKVAYCYLHNEEDSMDAVCNGIEKAYKNIKNLKKVNYFETWFIRIVINECKLILRAKEKDKKLADSLYTANFYEDNRDKKIDLKKALDELNKEDRILIFLKYYWGYTLEEIAKLTDLPEGTVKTKIYGSLKKIRTKLEVREV